MTAFVTVIREVSIILPVRNGASTLAAAIRSCLEQTFSDFELLVVDDGSDDGSAEMAAAFARADGRVRVLRCAGKVGVAAAFQLGFLESRGVFVARMDADDINAPERLESQVRRLRQHSSLGGVSSLVHIRRRRVDGSLGPPDGGYRRFEAWLNRHVTPEAIAAQRFVDQPLVNPSMMVRREILAEAGGYRKGEWAEDYDLWLRLLDAGHSFAKISKVLFTWIDHDARLTRTENLYAHKRFLRCKAHFLAKLPSVRRGGVSVCGAGPIGKTLARFLLEENVRVHRFYEVHPRRVGQVIGGTAVEPMDAWQGCTGDVVLGAVGQAGRREQIAKLAGERGYTEGADFFSVA